MHKQNEFIKSIENNDFNNIKLLLKDSEVDPSFDNNAAIGRASANGYIKILTLLLQDSRVDPSDYENAALLNACMHENIKIVKLLLKDERVDPSALHNYAIQMCEQNKYKEIVSVIWNHIKVKNTLKKHNLYLYNKLTKQDVKNKICEF